jgi:hypothetical protein
MSRCSVAAAICALSLMTPMAQAQSVTGRLQLSRDSDALREATSSAGYIGAAGLGVEAGTLRYETPDWRATGTRLAGTYRRHDESLKLDARLGVADLGAHTRAVGAADALWSLAGGSALGLSLERDFVASRGGIERGLVYDSAAVVVDHAFHERFNVGLAAGTARFSDANRRDLLRTRWNVELVPDWGLNAYLKTRNYRNTKPYRPEYFSPQRLGEASAGLSSRVAVATHAVFAVGADAGRQHTENGNQRIWSYSLRLTAPRRDALQWSVGVDATTAAGVAQASAASAYRYTSVNAQLSSPF